MPTKASLVLVLVAASPFAAVAEDMTVLAEGGEEQPPRTSTRTATTTMSHEYDADVLQVWEVVPSHLLHPSAQMAYTCNICRANWERV